MIQSNVNIRTATSADITTRLRLLRRMCAIASDTRKGCRLRRKSSSPLVTGSMLRYSKRPKENNEAAVMPTDQRHAISASVSDGRRNAARNPSAVGEMDMHAQDNSSVVTVHTPLSS